MRKILITSVLAAAINPIFSQIWTNDLARPNAEETSRLGTENKRSLNFYTNDSLRFSVDSLGGLLIPKLVNGGIRMLYVDDGGHISSKQAPTFDPSSQCIPNKGAWFEGGNNIGGGGSNIIGPCNTTPFILQSDSKHMVFLNTNGKVGIGENNHTPGNILDVSNPSNPDNTPVRDHMRFSGDYYGVVEATSRMNLFYNGEFNLQEGVPGGTADLKITSDPAGITLHPQTQIGMAAGSLNLAKLNVNVTGASGAPVNAIDIYDSYTTKVNFRVKSDGHTYAREVNVQLSNFPDYVFATNYKLQSLESLERYIRENQHLPNVPSAAEIDKNGADLGELSKIQMEKIEELTLYIIALKKEIDQLKEKIK